MKKYAFIILFFLVSVIYGESLWKDRDLYSNRSRLKVGDIIKVVFSHKSIVRYKNESKIGSTTKVTFGKPGIKIFSFLPNLDYNTSKDRNIKVDYSTEKEYNTTIAVTIQTIKANNIITISGNHSVIMNNQLEQIKLTGEVNLSDLADGNRIYSTDIANLSFEYKGPIPRISNPITTNDLVYTTTTNISNGVTNIKSSVLPNLNPELRKKLILQYLNRIAAILFKN
ncbi:MAG: flagellar basal body L-ring protein FlgH [Spirochaetes bacterium]|nr:flagellar basal body L-ring protein FlgH [Spirochaetota bacterium]